MFPFVTRRQGSVIAFVLAAILVAVGLVAAGHFAASHQAAAETPELLTTTVWKGPYDFAVVTRGTIQSASNVELRCEVHSRSGGTTILDVVPEGTVVQEGDVVVELDTSNLLLEEEQQKILVSTRESLVAEAENALKAAQIAHTEYLEGVFVAAEKQLLSELYLAQRAKAAAETALESSKVLYEKTIITAKQVEAAHAALDDATNKLESVESNLTTLRDLTKQKELTLLEAAIASAEANLKSQQRNLQLEEQRLRNIENQMANCTIRATAAGEVVYANEPEFYRSSTHAPFVVTPGALVRERQVIVRLPNADDMEVRATINEARVTLIRPGMPVSIRLDALDDELAGEVTKVNQFLEPGPSWAGNKYATTIKIKDPPRDLRVGMNAEAWIHVEQTPDALQLPVQALAESQGRYYSLVRSGDEFETREIDIGSTNDQVATIDRGLAEGDEVVINPRAAGGLLKLPEISDAAPIAVGD